MDANGDYNHNSKPDIALHTFIQGAGLGDPYRMRFPSQIHIYMYGKRRIDYILMDVALEQALEKIGYLASHERNMSDHVYAFVDLAEIKLFQGILYRPVDIQSHEFRIEQTDKKVAFQKNLREK